MYVFDTFYQSIIFLDFYFIFCSKFYLKQKSRLPLFLKGKKKNRVYGSMILWVSAHLQTHLDTCNKYLHIYIFKKQPYSSEGY